MEVKDQNIIDKMKSFQDGETFDNEDKEYIKFNNKIYNKKVVGMNFNEFKNDCITYLNSNFQNKRRARCLKNFELIKQLLAKDNINIDASLDDFIKK